MKLNYIPLIFLSLLLPSCTDKPAGPPVGADFMGSESCMECHETEYKNWLESDHYRAQADADTNSVLGDFNNAILKSKGKTHRFFRVGNDYYISTIDRKNVLKEFKISKVLGHFPLQQYMTEFGDGRIQVFHLAWDSRSHERGGQRWFDLYAHEKTPPGDELHWTGDNFNWNFMCADCHVTSFQKNYSSISNTYASSWKEQNVSCEACHGPSSEHVKWAEPYRGKKKSFALNAWEMGLMKKLKNPIKNIAWYFDKETGKPVRSSPIKDEDRARKLNLCAPCHSHRRPLEENSHTDKSFLDSYKPSLLDPHLYHPDGQIDDEVFVYGSYVQSKMYQAGVGCSDCHDVHSGKAMYPDNRLCIRCHSPDVYDTPLHHFHNVSNKGSSCVECHMPDKLYMGVDRRRDHSIRSPRPDLTKKLGSPNACSQCHKDKSLDWNINAWKKWWPDAEKRHFGEAISDGRKGTPGADRELSALYKSNEIVDIVKASLMEILARYDTPLARSTRRDALLDSSAIIRGAAIASYQNDPVNSFPKHIEQMLDDPVKLVRMEAVRLLSSVPVSLFTNKNSSAFSKRIEEYVSYLSLTIDRPNTRIRLAELYYQLGRTQDGEKHLAAALLSHPNDGNVHHFMGLYYIRTTRYEKALVHLRKAADLLPDYARFQYFAGVSLNQLGQFPLALKYLQRAHHLEPNNREYLQGLAAVCRDNGRNDLYRKYLKLLDGN